MSARFSGASGCVAGAAGAGMGLVLAGTLGRGVGDAALVVKYMYPQYKVPANTAKGSNIKNEHPIAAVAQPGL